MLITLFEGIEGKESLAETRRRRERRGRGEERNIELNE